MTTTDFNEFLSNIEDLEDAFCLDQTIRTKSDYGCYHYQEKEGNVFIKATYPQETTLHLASEKAQKYFLDLLERSWSEEGIPLGVYYEMKRQMEKED